MSKRFQASVIAWLGAVLLVLGFIGFKLGGVVKATNAMEHWNALNMPLLCIGGAVTATGFILGNRTYGKRGTRWTPYWMIFPAMVALVVFVLYPILNVIFLSLFKGNALNPTKEFLGLKNYVSMFNKTAFQNAVTNTLIYAVAFVVLVMIFSLLMAVWLFDDRKINKLCQTAIFTPHLIAAVSCAFIWRWILDYNSYGLINSFLRVLGVAPVPWLESSSTALLCIIIMNTWKNIGYYTLIMIAAMKSIPSEIYEAGVLDGAGPVRRFFKITLPLISPQLFFTLILLTIGSFNVFDSVNAMTEGGPGSSTEVIARFIYMFAFKNNNTLGMGSAAAVFLMSLQMALTVLYFKLLEKRVHYQ